MRLCPAVVRSSPGLLPVVALSTTATTLAWGITPFVPLFLLGRGVEPLWMGVAVAATAVGSLFAQYPAGRLCDRVDVATVATVALLLEGLGCLAFLLVDDVALLVTARALAGAGRAAVGQVARVVVVRTVAPDRRGAAFGLLGGATMAGITLGPAIGGLAAGVSLEAVFAAGAASSLLALPLVGMLPGRRPDAAPPDAAPPDAAPPDAMPGRRALLFGIGLEMVAGSLLVGSYHAVWSPFLADRGAEPEVIGLSFSLFALPYLVLAPVAGSLTDRWGRGRMALAGTVASAALMLAYPHLWWLPLIMLGEVLEAVCGALSEPALEAMAADAATDEDAGHVFGLLGTAQSVAQFAGTLGAAALLPLGLAAPFRVAAMCALGLAGAAALTWYSPRRRTPSAPLESYSGTVQHQGGMS